MRVFFSPLKWGNFSFIHTSFTLPELCNSLCRRPLSNKLFIRRITVFRGYTGNRLNNRHVHDRLQVDVVLSLLPSSATRPWSSTNTIV